MKKQFPAWSVLGVISLMAGLLLAVTNELTTPVIQEQIRAAAEEARREVLPAAVSFEEVPAEDAVVDNCYAALDDSGNILGYVAQITVKGYGGEIEITEGMDNSGVITGIKVGGANFSETAGLGARTKEPAFTEQFIGLTPPAALKENVDGITGASISSGAVVSGVNKIADHINALMNGGETEDESPLTVSGELIEQAAADGIDMWWKADEGIVIQTTEKGFGGPIEIKLGMDNNGIITGLAVGGEGFAETAGLGERTLEKAFRDQFIGAAGAIEYGSGIDAVSGATVSSTAVLTAVNRAMEFGRSVLEID